ncbi:MAG TPA: hypothetical protein VGH27_23015 [Streptosporangiaceae bacterium]
MATSRDLPHQLVGGFGGAGQVEQNAGMSGHRVLRQRVDGAAYRGEAEIFDSVRCQSGEQGGGLVGQG